MKKLEKHKRGSVYIFLEENVNIAFIRWKNNLSVFSSEEGVFFDC